MEARSGRGAFWRVPKAMAGAVLLVGGLLGAQVEPQPVERTGPAAGAEENARPEGLPSGAGQALLLEACVQCHDLRPVTSQRKTAAGWRRSVNEMIWRGAPLMPGEAEVLSRYLAASFGTREQTSISAVRRAGAGPSKEDDSRFLPPGHGRALVLKACLKCHGVVTTVSQRKTREGWRRSVHQMVAIGAPLVGGESEVLTDYLAAAFGPDDPVPDALKKRARATLSQ